MKLAALCKRLFWNGHLSTKINYSGASVHPAWQVSIPRKFLLVMRISVILLFVLAQHVSANTFSQTVTLTAKRMPLTQVFNTIKQQTGYSFFWDQQLLDKAPLITISVKDASIETALDNCLKGLNLSYEIKGNIVLIKQRAAAVSRESIAALAPPSPLEKHKISGVVNDEKGKPLSGAIVLLEPFSWKTVTNNKGEYSFNDVPTGRYRVEISYVGYTNRSITLLVEKDAMNINAQLIPEISEQEEVVLSTGYQKLKKNSVTGSFSVVSAKELRETPSPNIMERLEGKVPGVLFDVRNNTIRVRGVNTFSGSSNQIDPLIVIDGFPYIDQQLTSVRNSQLTTGSTSGSTNPTLKNQPTYSGVSILSSFNPDDIESITFLKDAAAAAIWGAQAANGVIVVETKKGRKNTGAQVRLSATYTTSKAPSVANVNAMSSKDYIDLEQELYTKGFYADPYTDYRNANLTTAVDWMYRAQRGMVTAAQRDSVLNALAGVSNIDQMQDYLLQRVKSQQYNLSLSGGGENSTYNITGSYMRNNPVYKSNYAESYFLTANLSNEFLNKRLLMNTLLSYNFSKNQMNDAALIGLGTGSFGVAPYEMLVDANGNPIGRSIMFTERIADSLQNLGHMSWRYSPVQELNYNNTVQNKTALRANIGLTGKITSWLNVQLSGQLQRNIERQDNIQDLNSYYTRVLVNTGSVYSGGRLTNNFPKGGIYKMANVDGEDYSVRGQVNASKNWGGKHEFSALAGAEIRQSKALGYKQARYGYDPITNTSATINPTTPYATMYPGRTATIGFSDGVVYKSRLRYLSYFSNASYTYLNKYSISGSMRFDDLTMLGVRRKNRAVPLWSAGARWDIAKEDFMKQLKWINSLALRTSWGTGGVAPVNSVSLPIVTLGSDTYTGRQTATINAFNNPALTWQTTRSFNMGVDMGMFNNRLSLSFDIYDKRSYDIIASFPYNSTYGFDRITYNTGNMSNHGIDLGVTGVILRAKDFNWTSVFNFSYNTNKVTDARYPIDEMTIASNRTLTTGYATDALWVYRWAGLNNVGQPRIYDAKGGIINSANFPSLYAKDQVYAGRTTPPYFGGFINNFSYKNWTLSARFSYFLGHKFLMQDLQSSQYPSGSFISGRVSNSQLLVKRWRNPGDEAFTNVPGISNANSNTIVFYNGSDISVRDAGNVRFQQLTLGYQFPAAMLRKSGFFREAAINLTASNLGIIWRKNKDGIDPDYIMTGSYNNLPPTVSYALNLQLNF